LPTEPQRLKPSKHESSEREAIPEATLCAGGVGFRTSPTKKEGRAVPTALLKHGDDDARADPGPVASSARSPQTAASIIVGHRMNAEDRLEARLQLVEEHIRQENEHDLAGIMRTFGATARFDDEPLDAHHVGREDVRTFYSGMLQALPSLTLDVRQRHAAVDTVIVEVIVRGQHQGPWRGLPATGRHIELPLCGIFTFDEEDQLAGERAYYDRATLLRQLGIFHEPESAIGRLATVVMHPFTMAQVLARKLRR
jgi:steroid delta-isomerase-like uncharacterized protein